MQLKCLKQGGNNSVLICGLGCLKMEPELHLESVGEMQVGESWRWGVMNKARARNELGSREGWDWVESEKEPAWRSGGYEGLVVLSMSDIWGKGDSGGQDCRAQGDLYVALVCRAMREVAAETSCPSLGDTALTDTFLWPSVFHGAASHYFRTQARKHRTLQSISCASLRTLHWLYISLNKNQGHKSPVRFCHVCASPPATLPFMLFLAHKSPFCPSNMPDTHPSPS